MAEVTWLGDEDPAAQTITMFGHEFVRGEPTTVPDKDPYMAKLKANQLFSFGKAKADLVDPDDTQEVADLKAELDVRNVKYRANASADSLYKLLQKDEDDKAETAKLARS